MPCVTANRLRVGVMRPLASDGHKGWLKDFLRGQHECKLGAGIHKWPCAMLSIRLVQLSLIRRQMTLKAAIL
jgi:hypothetical protein